MQSVTLTTEETRKLLSCSCPDAVALYLYRKAQQPLETALDALHFTVPQMVAATDCLKLRHVPPFSRKSPSTRTPTCARR